MTVIASERVHTTTGTQRQVAAMVGDGCTDQEIADRMGWTLRSAETYVKRLREKVGARNRAHLVLIAVRRKWIE